MAGRYSGSNLGDPRLAQRCVCHCIFIWRFGNAEFAQQSAAMYGLRDALRWAIGRRFPVNPLGEMAGCRKRQERVPHSDTLFEGALGCKVEYVDGALLFDDSLIWPRLCR